MVRLTEVFKFVRRRLREASIDWDKFKKSPDNRKLSYSTSHPETGKLVRHDPETGKYWSSDPSGKDVEYDPSKDKPSASTEPSRPTKDDFFHLVPQPTQGAQGDVLSKAKEAGFKKLTNFLVNPDHWGRGQPNEKGSLNWEGTDWIRPKSKAAMEFMRIVTADKLRPTDAHKPDVWKKHFQHKFGPKG